MAPKKPTSGPAAYDSDAASDVSDHGAFSEDDFSGEENLSDAESDGAPAGSMIPPILTKDAAEQELERLVLGNSSGFRRMLFDDLEAAAAEGSMQMVHAPGDEDMEDMEDDDLFDFDFAGAAEGGVGKKGVAQAEPVAWEDSDDERMTVSLTSHTRLRKFRVAGEDDVINGTVYTDRLRKSFLQLNPTPKWAEYGNKIATQKRRRNSNASGSSDEEDADYGTMPIEKFLRDIGQIGAMANTKRRRLRPEVIDIQRSRDIPDMHKGAVSSLQFHPKFPILLSSSPSSVIFLHHIDPQAHPVPNPRMTSVQARQVDVRRSEFRYPAGDKVVFAGRRKYYHSWDLDTGVVQKTTRVYGHKEEHKTMEYFRLSPCGRFMGIMGSSRKGGGVVNIVDTNTSNWIAAARLDSRHGIADFAWWRTGDGLTILGRDGQVGEYSVINQRFVGVWRDEGNIGGTVISLGGSSGPSELGEDAWVAVGSTAGICNLYSRHDLFTIGSDSTVTIKARPTPTKVLEQLITPITAIAFAPDGQVMAFASREKKDAFRLVHLPSCSVYRNWPTAETPLGRVSAVAFSEQGVLAVGNDSGKIRTWEIRA